MDKVSTCSSSRELVFERSINIKFSLDPEHRDVIHVHASLLDLEHSLHVFLKVNSSTASIIEAHGRMMRVPFRACRLSEGKIRSIEGLRIQKGVNREIAARVGGPEGCTHFVEILQSALRFTSANLIGLRLKMDEEMIKKLTDEERIAKSFDVLKNTCIAFNEKRVMEEGGK